MASYDATIKYFAAAASKHASRLKCFARTGANEACVAAKGPTWLEGDLMLAIEHREDDHVLQVRALGFPPLIKLDRATAFLTLMCGDALPGLQLSVRGDGNVNAIFTQMLPESNNDESISADVADRMFTTALAGLALVAAYSVFVNLADAGVSERDARRRAYRAFQRYDELLAGNVAWESLKRSARTNRR